MKTRLDEKLLASDFTFGFELEAYVYDKYIPIDKTSEAWKRVEEFVKEYPDMFNHEQKDLDKINTVGDVLNVYLLDDIEASTDDPTYREDICGYDNVVKAAKKLLQDEKYFPKDAKWIKIPSKGFTHDGSLNEFGFEWRSPVMILTPESIAHTIAFLKHCKKNHIYTDEKCGFHTHISFNGITEDDAKWIIMNLAMDKKQTDKILELQLFNDKENNTEPVDFRSEWSGTKYLKDLKNLLTKLSKETDSNKINQIIESINNLLTDEKYRALRIHPQGTLEWRSPREFIEYDDDYIKSFFLSLYDFISWMRKVLDSKELCNYSRDNLLKMINSVDGVEHPFRNDTLYKKVLDKLEENPYNILKLGKIPLARMERIFHAIYDTNISKKITNIVKDLALEGKQIPNNVLSCVMSFEESRQKCGELIKILRQPLPIRELETVNKISFGVKGLQCIMSNIDVLSKDDMIQLITQTTLPYDIFVRELSYHFGELNEQTKRYMLNLMQQKYNKNVDVIKNDL